MTAPHERLRTGLINLTLYLDDPADTACYTRDCIGKYVRTAPLMVCPCTTEEGATVLHICSEVDVPMVPQASNNCYSIKWPNDKDNHTYL